MSRLPHYSPVFPNWPALRLERVVGRIVVQDHAGVVGGVSPALAGPATDFLERCLAYEPSSRITAREALAHWFIDPFAADRATAAAAARAAAQALRDAQRTFGGFHSDFYPPKRMKRARLVTPPNGFPATLEPCGTHAVSTPGRVSPLLQGMEALYTAADMAED